jgi:(p)ppGpp synthase/HD superfamily hydrolase
MTTLTPRFEEALVYAAEAHAGQVRKTTNVPFLAHVLAVSALALEYGANEDEAIAALLHDTVEDSGGLPRLADVRQRFGPAVAEIVDFCTDATEIPKPPWMPRKEAFLKRIVKAPRGAFLVAACDKLHNGRSLVAALRTQGEAVWRMFNGGKEGTLWYFRSMLDVLSRGDLPTRLIDDLRLVVQEMHRLSGVEGT